MRSENREAALKHNPRTETQDEKRWRPLIINHPGHYLTESFPRAPSLSNTHTYTKVSITTSFHSAPSDFIYQTDKLFIVPVIILKLHYSFAGECATAAVIRTHFASPPGSIVCFSGGMCACMSFCECLRSSDSLCRVPGRKDPFIWHGRVVLSI